MRRMTAIAGACVGVVVITGCGAGGAAHSGGAVVAGATFTAALSADPGNLDPQGSLTGNITEISQFAYDDLVDVTAAGTIVSGLASAWKVTGSQVVLTMRKGVTCSDGAAFTAADAAANLDYVADPKSKSPLLGLFLQSGAHATADQSAGTVTLTTPTPGPFVLNDLAELPMVCAAGMKDRGMLAHQTDGTGPYQLTSADPGNQYTYTERTGYSWGPGGAGMTAKGLPAKVVFKVIPNVTTAANLLLSGGLNAATVYGADAQRLSRSGLYSSDQTNLVGEMWFNQARGRVGADQSVRLALTRALDLPQLQKVLTAGVGEAASTLAASPPVACPGDSVGDALPTYDLAAARRLLDQDGWKTGSNGVRTKDGKSLSVTFVYDTAAGSAGSSAAELAVSMWKQLGVAVSTQPQDSTTIGDTLFSTGNWDIAWEPVGVDSPDQLVPFLSGAAVPNGDNFADIGNTAYDAAVKTAAALPGTAGCADWLKAEANVISAADVVPFADQIVRTYGSDARFSQALTLIPTSIRMLAG